MSSKIKESSLSITDELSELRLKEIIYENSKSFYFASQFLPKKQRFAIWSLYAFCRATDDLIDRNENASLAEIDAWEADFNATTPSNVILSNFKKVVNEYNIPLEYPNDLIAGCRRDLTQKRYETFADLSSYCYQVAATVGLMSAYIVGFDKNHEAEMKEKAIKVGIALQLTNIIRDVGEDLQRGRLYLPLEDFAACSCNPEMPEQWLNTKPFKKLIHLQIKRARALYKEGWSGLRYLGAAGRFSVGTALGVYEEILHSVENNNYDVLNQRAHVTLVKKLSLLPIFWWRLSFALR